MSTETDLTIERARATMRRVADEYRGERTVQRRPVRRGGASVGTRLAFIAAANAILLIAAAVVGMVMPIGIFGALLVLLLMAAVTLAIAFAPSVAKAPDPQVLRQVDLKVLPSKTERWLDAQRPALPAPAMTLVDQIGLRLDTLTPQLARLDEGTEEAHEVRRLIGEQLPEFIKDYSKVPASLRTTPRNGKTPDAELVSGLQVIEQEIADMTARLAQGDLDSLQTRGRYLEMKYKGDDAAG